MTPTPTYARFLTQIGISSIATGSNESATDVLINMFAALAGAAHPDSRLVCDETGQSFGVGIDTLTCGPASIGGLNDHVISPFHRIQNQHLRNTEARAAFTFDDSRAGRGGNFVPVELKTAKTGQSADLIADTFTSYCREHPWLESSNLTQTMAELRMRPAVLYDTPDRAQLSSQLQRSHLGRPVVIIRISKADLIESCESIFLAITNGVTLNTELPYQIQGHVHAAMPPTELKKLVESGDISGIVRNTLWLTGGSFGSFSWANETKLSKLSLQSRYKQALSNVLGERYTGHPVELNITAATANACSEFNEHLHTLESQMPGISGSLRSLMPTLVFGLSVLYGCHRTQKSRALDDQTPILSDLSRALAQRMVDFQRAVLQAGRLEYLQRVAGSLCVKLKGKPQSVRELTRRFNSLPVADCREALGYLVATGVATVNGDVWRLTDSTNLTSTVNIETTTIQ